MSEEERRRQVIDIEWFEKTIKSYIGHLGCTIKDFSIWGHPDGFNPYDGVSLTITVLGPELPTPQEYIDLLKIRFGEDYFTLPNEDRKLPLDYSGAMYLGSVRNRYISLDIKKKETTTIHYYVFDDAILPFDDEWVLTSGPRPILLSYENLQFWERLVGDNERKEKDRET